jgi:multidrug resistance protein MdtO
MPARVEGNSRNSSGLFGWLRYELAPKDGRGWAVARMVTASVITTAIAMVFRIPESAYMTYIVFLISRDEKASTFASAAGGMAAVTLAIAAALGLSLIDLSESALRLPAMAGITFLSMYGLRVFALGPITYLAGFVIVMLQSVVDDLPNPEALTRLTLWMWVVLFVPIVITVSLNILFAPSVALLRNREFRRILGELAQSLREDSDELLLERYRERVVELLDKKTPPKTQSVKRATVNAIVLRELLQFLILLGSVESSVRRNCGLAWANELDLIQARVGELQPGIPFRRPSVVPIEHHPSALAIDANLAALSHSFEETEPPAGRKTEKQMLLKDAISNPAHWQFAFKTTFAVMIVYSLYTLMDWPGLRTSIVTCFFVALGSLGETVHKLTLRISGALIGGVLAALCIVFVLPHCTDIGQLCLIIAAVSAAAAWVATSSEQLSYAGLQIAFAFFLGMFQDYAPATDLTVLRDRVAGILLGNVVMTIVFSALWPQSAAFRVRSAVGQVLRALASLLKASAEAAVNRELAARGLVLAEHFRTLRGFELQLVPGHAPVERIGSLLRALAILEGRVFVSTFPEVLPGYRDVDRHALGHWADEAAAAAEFGVRWPSPPTLAPGYSEAVDNVISAAHQAAQCSQLQERA